MNRGYDLMVVDQKKENYFKLLKLKKGIEVEDEEPQDADIESVLHVKYELVNSGQHNKRLSIQCSSDGMHWNAFELGYNSFKQRVSRGIKKMLADGKSNFTIQLSWLKGFDIIASVRHCMGKLAMYATAVGAIEQESWKTKVWGIFEDLNDSFWNSHRVKLCFSMQRSERAVSVSAFYSKKDSELKEVQPLSNYHSILLNALNILLYDVEEELRLIPWTCTCRIWTGGQEDMVMREVDRQLNTYGASLIRKQHTYYVSKQHRLQEHQRQAIKKLCSETIATLKTLNPVMHLIEVKHKTSGSRAVVGCYHDKVAAETIAHTLEKSMPEVDYIEYIITSLCSSAISKKLLRRIDYTDESILQ